MNNNNIEIKIMAMENELRDLERENKRLKEQVELLTGVIVEQHGDYFL